MMASLLVVTTLLPLLGGLVLFMMPRLDKATARAIALATALASLGLSLVLLAAFKTGELAPQFAFVDAGGHYGLGWLGRPDIRFSLGLDGLSLWLYVLTALLMLPAIFASWESIDDRPAMHYAFLLALETGMLGLFASLDVVLFYIFFEFTLIPLFFLIGIWGGEQKRRAAVTFFLYTLAGSLLTLLGVIALVVVHYQHAPGHVLTFSIPELTRGLAGITRESWPDWYATDSWRTSPQALIFLLLFAGFAIKVPMFPFHTWLPLAHVEAPAAGSILLAGVLLKVGGYGLLRFNMSMTPLGAQVLFPFLATLSVAGVIYGALVALSQSDMKRLVAYSSVSHMGFIVLGIFAMNGTGMDGAVIQMVNHGLTTGALFACVGVIYERYHTREMSEMGGLWKRLPLFAFFLILASLGSAAVPGLNGFVGEFPILAGMFARSPRSAVLAATGMILGAYYLLWMVQCVLFGPLREPTGHGHGHGDAHGHGDVRPIAWHEIAGLTPLMVLIVAIGVYPKPFFDRFRPAVAEIAAKFAAPAPSGPAMAGAVGADVHAATARRDAVRTSTVSGAVTAAGAVPACCDPVSSLSRSRFRKTPIAGAAVGGGVEDGTPRGVESNANDDREAKDGGPGRRGPSGKGRGGSI
jgi:NADH-quinone oxidoreductase subunit M